VVPYDSNAFLMTSTSSVIASKSKQNIRFGLHPNHASERSPSLSIARVSETLMMQAVDFSPSELASRKVTRGTKLRMSSGFCVPGGDTPSKNLEA
jgi:hypothetical protein